MSTRELPPSALVNSMQYAPEHAGIAPYVHGLAAWLAGADWDTRVVAAHPYYPEWRLREGYGQWHLRTVEDGVDVHRVRHVVATKPSNVRRLLGELTYALHSATIRWRHRDVLVLVSPSLFSSAASLARVRLLRRRTKVVVWLQDMYTAGLLEHRGSLGLAGTVISRIERWLLRSADLVVTIHDRFSDRVVQDFGLDRSRLRVVRNWTHVTPVDDVDRSAVRRRFGWADDEFVVLHAGNQGAKQNLDEVVRLAPDLAGTRVRFVLLGHGNQNARLRELARDLPNVDMVEPVGDDLFMPMLAASDALLVCELPDAQEAAVPSKLTSYMAAGTPVLGIVNPDGITADEIRGSGAGIVVRHGDPADVERAVTALKDPETAAQHVASARGFLAANLSAEECLKRFESILAEVVRADA